MKDFAITIGQFGQAIALQILFDFGKYPLNFSFLHGDHRHGDSDPLPEIMTIGLGTTDRIVIAYPGNQFFYPAPLFLQR